jgi:hypothetical protein
MYQEYDDTRAIRVHLYFYALCQFIAGIIAIIAASLYWFRYCIFDFGLYVVDDIYSNISLDYDDIPEVQDGCDDGDFDSIEDYFCEDFCDHVDDIRQGSDAMITLTSFTLLLLLLNILLVLVRICKQSFRPKIVPIIVGGLSSILYLLGFIIYLGSTNFSSFDDTEGDDIEDLDVYGAVYMAGFLAFTMILIQIYGIICTRKAYFNS